MRFINVTKYPTAKDIFAVDPKIKQVIINVVLSWKKEFYKDWKNTPIKEKKGRLKVLILAITVIGFNKLVIIEDGKEDSYRSDLTTIFLHKTNPTILAALHETAHFLFGRSELKACRWSLCLYKRCFPGSFKNLSIK